MYVPPESLRGKNNFVNECSLTSDPTRSMMLFSPLHKGMRLDPNTAHCRVSLLCSFLKWSRVPGVLLTKWGPLPYEAARESRTRMKVTETTLRRCSPPPSVLGHSPNRFFRLRRAQTACGHSRPKAPATDHLMLSRFAGGPSRVLLKNHDPPHFVQRTTPFCALAPNRGKMRPSICPQTRQRMQNLAKDPVPNFHPDRQAAPARNTLRPSGRCTTTCSRCNCITNQSHRRRGHGLRADCVWKVERGGLMVSWWGASKQSPWQSDGMAFFR